MICSGGTSSRSAADGHLTIDMRRYFRDVAYEQASEQVWIGAGASMADLLVELSHNNRTFPTGLSGRPGMGYLLTGGVSPLSRSLGLAMDQILEFEGVWGNGQSFSLTIPGELSSSEDWSLWRALNGAAPFLGVVTKLRLKTFPLQALRVWQALLTPKQLKKAIIQAEQWPKSASFQWIWSDNILAYVVVLNADQEAENCLQRLRKSLSDCIEMSDQQIPGLHQLPLFAAEQGNAKSYVRQHSEVLSLLSHQWGSKCNEIIKILHKAMAIRPDPGCCIASQQLGGMTAAKGPKETAFIHRQAQWKPWITAVWPAGDLRARDRSLDWLRGTWSDLEPFCLGVQMAQLHPHLSWHKQTLRSAYGGWLPSLQNLKVMLDPNGLLPRL